MESKAPPRPPPLVSPPPPHNPTTAAANSTTTSPPQSPVVIHGKYVLTRLLGRGSFAKVYHGRSLLQTDSSSSSVAIKVFDKEKIDSSMAPRLLREIDAMRRLTHPNIVRIHEVLATKSKIYLVMDLAPGGDLLGKLSRRQGHRFPEPISRRYFRQLVSALRYCHLTGVAHRDLKPQNILLDHNGDLKISDFGLSAVGTTSSSSGDGLASLRTACGTPAFAAPEVMGRSRQGYDGEKADAWSCGVILYAMLAGALPFADGNLVLMYRKMQRREVHFPAHVTRPARALIMKLLDPNPATRMSVDEITKGPWYKGSQTNNTTTPTMRNCLSLGDLVSVMDEGGEFERPAVVSKSSMNAFDIISMSSGLDLSGLLDDEGGSLRRRRKDKERRFTTMEPSGALVEKVIDVGGKLGYEVQRGRAAGKVWLGKGRSVLIVEALEVGPEVSVVELRVVETNNGGDRSSWMEEVEWGEWKKGLGEIITSWQDEKMT